MKRNITLLFAIVLMAFSFPKLSAAQVGVQDIKICVVADLHLFDTTLLIQDGPAFQQYVAYDRKLLKESYAITKSVMDSIKAQSPDVVLVCGDLTKDGELASFQTLAGFFQELENAGAEVIVIPGNHDINNPHAVSFNDTAMIPVQGVTPADFKTVFSSFGYGQAIASDTASLSYVVEPVAGLQIIAADVCRYDSNYAHMHPETSGGYKPQVLQWVKYRLTEAKNNHKVVMLIQHHNLMEHYMGQKTMFSPYVIDDWDTVSTQFADLGLKTVFTGHYHAQDVVMKTTQAGYPIYDIETGSTVTYPCPYRVMTLGTDTMLEITGKRVEAIDYDLGGANFQSYAKSFLENGFPPLVMYMLMSPPYGLDSATAAMVTPAVVESFMAHYEGNEGTPTAQTNAIIQMLKQDPNYAMMGYMLEGMWNDPMPDDWTLSIDMNDTSFYSNVQSPLRLSEVVVFPNPSNGIYNLLLPESKQEVSVKVYDMLGSQVFEQKINQQQNVVIDLSELSAGQYILDVRFNGMRLTKKLLKK